METGSLWSRSITHKVLASELQAMREGGSKLPEPKLRVILFQILSALSYLHRQRITHRSLQPENVRLTEKGNVKLAGYGMYEYSDGGNLVPFPIGSPAYLAPEVVLVEGEEGIVPEVVEEEKKSGSSSATYSTTSTSPLRARTGPKADVWSFGVIVYELLTGKLPWGLTATAPAEEIFRKMFSLMGHSLSPSPAPSPSPSPSFGSSLANSDSDSDSSHSNQSHLSGTNATKSARVKGKAGLEAEVNVAAESNRDNDLAQERVPSLSQIEREDLHAQLAETHASLRATLHRNHARQLQGYSTELIELVSLCVVLDPVQRISLGELLNHPYFRTLLREGHLNECWVKKPFLRSSLVTVPSADDEEGAPSTRFGGGQTQELKLDELFALWLRAGGSLESLLPSHLKLPPPVLLLPAFLHLEEERPVYHYLSNSAPTIYDPTIVGISLASLRQFLTNSSASSQKNGVVEVRGRSLSARENNYLYQKRRILHFKKHLRAYPVSRSRIINDARRDIPPVLRGEIWAAILGAPSASEMNQLYSKYDLSVPHPSDPQIQLDVPRCHQYHPLLSSPEGHMKLTNILKVWVRHNPSLNYWQGVDSLLAPFLVLHFNDPPTAFYCLQNLITIYLKPFFMKEKSVYLQEHLCRFTQLLAFLDPELAMHMRRENFFADLFSIPWFLTMFAHIFAIHQISRIWDTVLVSPPSLPFFLAIAIMEALRELTLPLDFNALILLFSNLPELNIESLLRNSLEYLQHTPPSLTVTEYAPDESASHWWLKRRPLKVISQELFPRISVNDLIALKDTSVILDIRDEDEYNILHLPESVRVSPDSFDVEEVKEALLKFDNFNPSIVVVGKETSLSVEFANYLIEQEELPRVTLLNGGIESLVADAKGLLVGYGAAV